MKKRDRLFAGGKNMIGVWASRPGTSGRAPSKFYSPAYAIAQQIQDALNTEAVLQEAPTSARVEVSTEGVRVAVVRKLEDREKASCWLLPNGFVVWFPKSAVLAEKTSHIRVSEWIYRTKARLIKRQPADGMTRLSRDQVLEQLRVRGRLR